jgi:hypothetical protein
MGAGGRRASASTGALQGLGLGLQEAGRMDDDDLPGANSWAAPLQRGMAKSKSSAVFQ